ncbi:hypothetical protein HRbin17_02201 [bacterium HR17]|uniref:Uncharacterized protein n=1 Tax=Candidatus Fervidibacter japonicus TaxID=2035412 RepID=A0A2H5XER3_9BACT|nr:hypothetical protein HRbin17_02201 [bacterium HR17]
MRRLLFGGSGEPPSEQNNFCGLFWLGDEAMEAA